MYYWMIDITAIGQFNTHEEATKTLKDMTHPSGKIYIEHQSKMVCLDAKDIDIMHKDIADTL
jgi:hypothetical protein